MFQRVARGTLKDADLKAFLEKCLVRYGVAGCSAAVLQPDGVGGARIATVVGGFGCWALTLSRQPPSRRPPGPAPPELEHNTGAYLGVAPSS